MDSGKVTLLATEEVHDFDGCPERCERVHLQYFQRLDALEASVSVFVNQRIQHGASLVAVFGEDVALFDGLGAFAAGARRLIKRNVANKIKGVKLAAYLLGQFVLEHAPQRQFVEDRLLAVSGIPGV